jgi:hypothetical protein
MSSLRLAISMHSERNFVATWDGPRAGTPGGSPVGGGAVNLKRISRVEHSFWQLVVLDALFLRHCMERESREALFRAKQILEKSGAP